MQLIKRCWAHNVAMRPTFEQVKKFLDKMNPHKVSPVDMMMNLVGFWLSCYRRKKERMKPNVYLITVYQATQVYISEKH